jgi:hypothetical protein
MDENGCSWINSISDIGDDVNDDVRDVIHNITSHSSNKFHEDWLKIGFGFVWIFLMKCFHAMHGI